MGQTYYFNYSPDYSAAQWERPPIQPGKSMKNYPFKSSSDVKTTSRQLKGILGVTTTGSISDGAHLFKLD